ncbi:MAG: acyl-CoA carboxylase epsilon subunit [Actinomycetia bacterium]|nr:acyl-CoA carboxylase epsilon subunit [Actinomycetes bacterium]
MSKGQQETDQGATPSLRVISSDATPDEIAAIVAVLAATGGADTPEPSAPFSRWAAPSSRLRAPHDHGPGAWRRAGLRTH